MRLRQGQTRLAMLHLTRMTLFLALIALRSAARVQRHASLRSKPSRPRARERSIQILRQSTARAWKLPWIGIRTREHTCKVIRIQKNLFGDNDACCEVIHDYQLIHINDCNEAHDNIVWDVVFGYYCKSPKSTDTICAPECQESIDKLESVCNPAGGPIGTYTTTADDSTTTIQATYSWADMAAVGILGPDSCTYTTSLSSSAGTLSSPIAALAAASVVVAALLL